MTTQPKSFADKISAAYEAGCTIRDIAGDEGRSYAAIRDLLLRNGVTLRGRGGDTCSAARKPAGAARPDWADVRALMAEHRDSTLTDGELADLVMGLFGGEA
jgi:hypothetical protein